MSTTQFNLVHLYKITGEATTYGHAPGSVYVNDDFPIGRHIGISDDGVLMAIRPEFTTLEEYADDIKPGPKYRDYWCVVNVNGLPANDEDAKNFSPYVRALYAAPKKQIF